MQCLNLRERRGAGQHDGENVLFANPPGDELGILRTEIEDDNCLGVHASSVAGSRAECKERMGGCAELTQTGLVKGPFRTEWKVELCQVTYQGRIRGRILKAKPGMLKGITGPGLQTRIACFSNSRIDRFTARRESHKLRSGALVV